MNRRNLRAASVGAVSAAFWLLGVGPSPATATLSCEAGDRSLRFSAQAVVSHGLGESLSGFQGEMEVLLKSVPADLGKLSLAGEHLTHHWLHGRDVKLRLYRERDGEGSPGHVELVLETRAPAKDEPEHRGTYALTVYVAGASGTDGKTLKARGRATCSVG